jgi:hypothetical protein
MADTQLRKLNSSVAGAAIVTAFVFALGGGTAGYFLGVHHAERRAAAQIEKLQAESRVRGDSARRNLALSEEARGQLEVALNELVSRNKAAERQAEQFARKVEELEQRLTHDRR